MPEQLKNIGVLVAVIVLVVDIVFVAVGQIDVKVGGLIAGSAVAIIFR